MQHHQDVEHAASADANARQKGQCWCCWEPADSPANPLIRACLGCKDPDLQYIHQDCIDRWVTALPTPRTPPPHSHNCSRCGDPYDVETTPIPRIHVLITDPFLRFAMLLMVGCIAILTVCCGALIAQHWGTGLNIIDFGPWLRIRMTTFAAFMLAFCHSINFATCWMVWEHCGGEVRKHVVGVPEEVLEAFEAAERVAEGNGEGVRRERAERLVGERERLPSASPLLMPEGVDADDEDEDGNDEGETQPLLRAGSSLSTRIPAPIVHDDDGEEEEDSMHRHAPPRAPPHPTPFPPWLTSTLASTFGFTSRRPINSHHRPRPPPPPRSSSSHVASQQAGPSFSQRGSSSVRGGRRSREEGLRIVVVGDGEGPGEEVVVSPGSFLAWPGVLRDGVVVGPEEVDEEDGV
ncbi:hypothetical protein HDU67_004189 [Dinochytrium kinnereticum]|nr:hypothetical protein HDU67_004189 [Dinochytrium kinnereticum]